MSLSVETIAKLIAAGVEGDALVDVLRSIEADFARPSRTKNAERQARYRERHSNVTRNVTHNATDNDQGVSPKERSPRPPKEITPSPITTTETRERETDWGSRIAECVEAAEGVADMTIPTMHTARDLRPLVEPTSGEPCSWAEVLEAVKITALRQRGKGKTIRSWSWVAEDAWALRNRRLSSDAPDVATVVPFRAGTGPPGLADRIAADNAEARRRAFAQLDAQNGQQS